MDGPWTGRAAAVVVGDTTAWAWWWKTTTACWTRSMGCTAMRMDGPTPMCGLFGATCCTIRSMIPKGWTTCWRRGGWCWRNPRRSMMILRRHRCRRRGWQRRRHRGSDRRRNASSDGSLPMSPSPRRTMGSPPRNGRRSSARRKTRAGPWCWRCWAICPRPTLPPRIMSCSFASSILSRTTKIWS